MIKKPLKSALLLNLENGDIMAKSIERLIKEPDTEILIVDNCSKDSTIKVLRRYCTDQYLHQIRAWRWRKIKGQSYNRNFMIKKALGKYFLMLDTDILYVPGTFDYLIQRLETAPPEVKCIGFDSWGYTNDENEAATQPPSLDEPLKFREQPIAFTQYGVFKREIFTRFRIKFDERYGTGHGWEDDDLAMQMLKKGLKCAYVPLKYYHTRHTPAWWKLHSPEFMRHKERKELFDKKWGKSVSQKISNTTPKQDMDKAISARLLEEAEVDKIPNITDETKKKVRQLLQIIDIYKQKSPDKYEQKKEEFIKKLNKIIYGV
jgi:glycosyltransferase involved in cell wall biosynthesis